MIKNIPEIETALGLKAGDFKAAYEAAEEKVIDITGLEIVSKTDYATRIKNLKEEAGTAAVEIAVKKARTELGVDFEGKTMENLLLAHKTKVIAEANLNPDKRVTDLEKDLVKMRGNFETEKTKREGIENEFKQKENMRAVREAVISEIPANTIIPKDDVVNIFFSKNKAELDDAGKIVFKKGDEVLKNQTTLNPLSVKEVMTEFITPYVKPAVGGDGGGDNPGQPKAGTLQHFVEEMQKAGFNEGGSKFNEEMGKRIKEGTLKI